MNLLMVWMCALLAFVLQDLYTMITEIEHNARQHQLHVSRGDSSQDKDMVVTSEVVAFEGLSRDLYKSLRFANMNRIGIEDG
jgi:hypothetical protein